MADMNTLKEILNGTLDMVVPHARQEPLNPMAYVRDVNEWFAPAAQMALDEAEGKAEYPAWAYGLASVPFLGKVAKPAAKVISRTARKELPKILDKGEVFKITARNPETGETVSKVVGGKVDAQNQFYGFDEHGWEPSIEAVEPANNASNIDELFAKLNEAQQTWDEHPSLVNQSNRDKALSALMESEDYNGYNVVDGKYVPREGKPSKEWTLTKEEDWGKKYNENAKASREYNEKFPYDDEGKHEYYRTMGDIFYDLSKGRVDPEIKDAIVEAIEDGDIEKINHLQYGK